jgi:protein O-mannosyl-transferase
VKNALSNEAQAELRNASLMTTSHESLNGRGWLAAPAVLAMYLAVGVTVYARILPSFFVADDFAYLHEIAVSQSPSIIFSALAGRYFRPMVVFAYYLNYQISALDPFSYHLTVVLLNVGNAWLVFLLGRALAAPPLAAPLAGLLFLVFGGHAEAITWIGGMADPLVTMFVLVALLLFLRALEHERPLGFVVAVWAAFAGALLSKESAAILPGLLIVATALARSDGGLLRAWRVLVMTLAGMAVLFVGYLLLRKSILGFAFVNLGGLGTNTNFIATTRAFIIRSFLPQGELALTVFLYRFDLLLGVPIVGLLAWGLKKSVLRSLAFIALCFGIALTPVLPLSIAMATPESERLIYMASAFATLLLVWFLAAAIQQPRVLAAIVLACAVGNVVALARINQSWLEAASIVKNALPTFAEVIRTHGRSGKPLVFLNVPDNVRGAYVFRRGFHEALKMAAPEKLEAMADIGVLSVYGIGDVGVPTRVTATGPRSVQVKLDGGWLIGAANPPTPKVALKDWSLQSFAADFTTGADGSLILYFTPRRIDVFGRVPF